MYKEWDKNVIFRIIFKTITAINYEDKRISSINNLLHIIKKYTVLSWNQAHIISLEVDFSKQHNISSVGILTKRQACNMFYWKSAC